MSKMPRTYESLNLPPLTDEQLKRLKTVKGMKEEDIMEQYSSYASFSPSSIAVTKLDETETIGNVLSFSYSVGVPITFFTDGQKVPEDIKKASSSLLLEHMKGFGLDMKGFKAQLSL